MTKEKINPLNELSTSYMDDQQVQEIPSLQKRHMPRKLIGLALFPKAPNITFVNQDAEGLHMPHDDAMEIKLSITNCLVKKVWIDNGSSVDVIFFSMPRKVRYNDNKMDNVSMNLVEFNAEPNKVNGKVVMPITANRVIMYSTMMIIKGDLAYIILVRPWLHMMKAIPLTYHHMLKFAYGKKIKTLKVIKR